MNTTNLGINIKIPEDIAFKLAKKFGMAMLVEDVDGDAPKDVSLADVDVYLEEHIKKVVEEYYFPHIKEIKLGELLKRQENIEIRASLSVKEIIKKSITLDSSK